MTMSIHEIQELLSFNEADTARFQLLLSRAAALGFAISEYENIGIFFMTRADTDEYPTRIRKALGRMCPPVFCYSGNRSLLDCSAIGFAGSKDTKEADVLFTKEIAIKAIKNDYAIVSGGDIGVESIALETAIEHNHPAIAILTDSLMNRLRNKEYRIAVQNGSMLLLSPFVSNATIKRWPEMEQNKYVYAQSEGTVVVRAGYPKSETYNGAAEALSKQLTTILCWNNPEYYGNQVLIQNGAIPIDADWPGYLGDTLCETESVDAVVEEQISLI
jgi:predicted Rossmann fold nucleotide-binding protein DprA/Smf involved in DNA uptake